MSKLNFLLALLLRRRFVLVATTAVAPSSTPAPCDCVNVIRGVCETVEDSQQCASACQGQGLGGGFCVGVRGVNAEVALCVCIGPFLPGSGGSNGCVADTTPALPSTTPSDTTSASVSSTNGPSTSLASSSPAPCDCVHVIRGVCQAIVDTEKCVAACQGLGLGAGACVDLYGVGAEVALCVCIGPFQPGAGGGNGCEAATTPALPTTTPSAATTASESPSSSSVITTAIVSSTPGPCDCVHVIRRVCRAIVDTENCIIACQGLGLGAGVCVDLFGIGAEAALCVCTGPFGPGSGGGNGCEAATTTVLPTTTESAPTTVSESTSSTSAITTSIASSTPAPCDCVNVIRGVCRAVANNEDCIRACQRLGLGAGVCVDLFGVGAEAALCVCTGPFGPGSGGGNGCEASTTPSLPTTTPSVAPSEPTTVSVSPSTSAVSTTAPGQCIRSIDDICKDPLRAVDNAICNQQCKDLGLGFRAGICIDLPDHLHMGVGLCICL
ncbi:hypothetical protein AAVH_28191 [Aphelenchoides avenae]|nr:hypothetical protein AAVH_28191 [Aphelenchus avenae]